MVSKATGKKKAQTRKKATPVSENEAAVDLQELRQKLVQLIGGRTEKMTAAIIDEADRGHLTHYKFLLEVIGLYPPIASEKEKAEDSDDLAQVLLKSFAFPKRLPEEEKGEAAEPAAAVGSDSVE